MEIEKIANIAIDIYGKDYVDVNDYIYIYFPEITITNENNHFHKIYDTFIRVETGDRIRFSIKRTTFTEEEYKAGYIHSHAPCRHINHWQYMCLGTGPIGSTITSLTVDKDNEDLWKLFFIELNEYLQTESLSGGPYIRMDILNYGTPYNIRPIKQHSQDEFDPTDSKIRKKFNNIAKKTTFVYHNGSITIKNISEFVLACNEEFKNLILEDYFLKNFQVYLSYPTSERNRETDSEIDSLCVDFKDRTFKGKILYIEKKEAIINTLSHYHLNTIAYIIINEISRKLLNS